MVSGRGAVVGNVYYLPLKKDTKKDGPAVCAVDLKKGVLLETVAAGQHEVPGNLVFHRGEVISQTAATLTVYPQRQSESSQLAPRVGVLLTPRSQTLFGNASVRNSVSRPER